MPLSSPPRDNGHVVANGDINKLSSTSPPKGSPGRGVVEAIQSSPLLLQAAKLTPRGPPIPVPALDGRSDLLKAIRDGNLNLSRLLNFCFATKKLVYSFFCRYIVT
jgi:hypothetical protein